MTDGLAARLREATRSLHIQAERGGMMALILRGKVSRAGYVSLLRNLLPVYTALESGLDAHRTTPATGLFALPAVYRSTALRADLAALAGHDWPGLPVLPEATGYAAAVTAAATGDGALLIAHAYTRTLGDLSGGQIMRGILARHLGLAEDELGFYSFPDIPELDAFKTGYRESIDTAGQQIGNAEAVVEEARVAFGHNIALSEALAECQAL